MSEDQGAAAGPSKGDPTSLSELLNSEENKGANCVIPLSWCPHLEESINKDLPQVPSSVVGHLERPCGHCTEDVRENWLCLTCHEVYCSRYVAEHMLFHGIEKNHLMTVSFCDLSVWCYGCEQYVDNEVLYPVQNMLHLEKFGVEKPKRVPVMSLA